MQLNDKEFSFTNLILNKLDKFSESDMLHK